MIKIRVTGVPEEVEKFVAEIKEQCNVLYVSGQYSNRGDSQYKRVYLELEAFSSEMQKALIKSKNEGLI